MLRFHHLRFPRPGVHVRPHAVPATATCGGRGRYHGTTGPRKEACVSETPFPPPFSLASLLSFHISYRSTCTPYPRLRRTADAHRPAHGPMCNSLPKRSSLRLYLFADFCNFFVGHVTRLGWCGIIEYAHTPYTFSSPSIQSLCPVELAISQGMWVSVVSVGKIWNE